MPRAPGSRARDYVANPRTNATGPRAVEPHSPWQLLIEEKRKALDIPIRELAASAQVPSGSLFNWLRAPSGGPSRKSYTANVNRRFAKALKITPKELSDAYNASMNKPLDPDAIEEPAPRAPVFEETPSAFAVDGLKSLLAMAKASGRTSFSLEDLERMASLFLPQASES